MNNTPRNDDMLRTRRPAAEEAPLRTVDEVKADWPMKGFRFRFDGRTSLWLILILAVLAVALVLSLVLLISGREIYFDFPSKPSTEESGGGVAAEKGDFPYADGVSGNVLLPWADRASIIQDAEIDASHAALADLATGQIIASRKDIYEQMKAAGSSGIGMVAGETLTVEAMLYALMLKSDGIAACELARYVAGSVEDFVELMNQKAEKMGLSNTHFENPTGLFHQNHRSTAREIASIMAYAMKMKLCRKILLTQSYVAPCVGADGKKFNYNLYHNLTVTQFERIPVNQPNTVKVAAGKTGFTDESLYCLVTYAESSDGHGYVCVTAKGASYATCIADYITIYDTYANP